MYATEDATGGTVAEILSTYLQQKKTYTQSIRDKKSRELARGYGQGRRTTFGGSHRADCDRPLRPEDTLPTM